MSRQRQYKRQQMHQKDKTAVGETAVGEKSVGETAVGTAVEQAEIEQSHGAPALCLAIALRECCDSDVQESY